MAWVKGQSGNPLGAPARVKPWREALARALRRRDEGQEIGTTLEKIADVVVALALSGDATAYREVADRFDGKVPQAVVGDDEHPPIQTETETIERIIIEHIKDTNSESFPTVAGSH
jgi:hypothetical protein